MFEHECTVNQFLIQYATGLLADIPDERMAEQPVPGVNHPAWIIAHLTFTGDAVVSLLGGEKSLPADWQGKFGPNSQLTTQREDYPSKAELLEMLQNRFALARELATKVDPQTMSAPNPRPQMRENLPTAGDLVAFILTGHLGIHLGQLSTWRRMTGSPRLF